jgi:hypothetical protein
MECSKISHQGVPRAKKTVLWGIKKMDGGMLTQAKLQDLLQKENVLENWSIIIKMYGWFLVY